jgi:hypothetical protein
MEIEDLFSVRGKIVLISGALSCLKGERLRLRRSHSCRWRPRKNGPSLRRRSDPQQPLRQ